MKIFAKKLSFGLFFCITSLYANNIDLSKEMANKMGVDNPHSPSVLNIPKANENGISHGKFNQFDISQAGLGLNNLAKSMHNKSGEWQEANPYLGGKAAGMIIIEIVDPQMRASQLDGIIKVIGQKADVIFANPWGINCNGCGFDNTATGILLTGIPRLDENGKLQGYYVGESVGGKVAIQGRGLIATGADYLSIMSRSVELNGPIYGKDRITYILGTNDVNRTGKVQPVKKDNPPTHALDVGDLGGMYANKIHLLSTEEGVGVKYDGRLDKSQIKQVDSQGNIEPNRRGADVTMTVNGPVTFSGSAEIAKLDIKSAGDVVFSNSGYIQTFDSADLNVGTVENKGTMKMDSASLTTKNLVNSGSIKLTGDQPSILKVTDQLNVSAGKITGDKIELHAPQPFDNGQGVISAKELNIILPPPPVQSEPPVQPVA